MTGLEKMISQIAGEAEAEAESMIKEAKEAAARTVAEARSEAEKECAEISGRSKVEEARYLERVKSSAELQRKQAILRAKQDVIAKTMDEAYAALAGLEKKEYFDFIRKLLKKYVLAGEGEIYFSVQDMERFPKGFEREISELAAEKGGSLTLRKEGKDIENGFILAYGGIEENCTFRALFNTRRDELLDIIHREMFT